MKSEEAPAYGWVVLGTFSLSYSVVVIAVFTLGVLLPDISDDLSLSLPNRVGWLPRCYSATWSSKSRLTGGCLDTDPGG